MPKYLCSYAYNVPCYADFYIDAKTAAEAEELLREKLKSGAFSGVSGTPFWENAGSNERVFVSGKVPTNDDPGVSLDELLETDKSPR